MKAVEFEQVNVRIAEHQDEYETLPAYVVNEPEGRIISCFELSDEEIKQIVKTKRIWHQQLTFKGAVRPIKITVENPFE